MTDNKEVKKMVNENMDSNSETHSEDNGDVGSTTPVGTTGPTDPTPTDPTVTPKEGEFHLHSTT